MSARQLHALVAAGLHDPALLRSWADAPAELAAHGREAAAINLGGLTGFAGLTAKVRHNGLRDDYPLTFRLLKATALEARLFTDYTVAYARQGRRFAAAPSERGSELADFIMLWADRGSSAGAMLADIVRHERELARLRGGGAMAEAAPPGPARPPRLVDVPRLVGSLELVELGHDPEILRAALCCAVPALDSVAPSPTLIGYRRGPDGAAVVLRLDAFSFAFLRLVDGEASLGVIARALKLPRPHSIGPAAGQLAAAGLINLDALKSRP